MTQTLAHWQAYCRDMLSASPEHQQDAAHDLNHFERVWATAQQLLKAHPEANTLQVMLACYLHDLVNLPKNHPDRSQGSRMAADLACERLAAAGLDVSLLPGLHHAIIAHSFSANVAPQSIEAQIVQDADRLDALGAIGLARLFYIAGKMDSRLAHPSDPLAQARPLDDRHYALDHIMVKLAKLPASMQTSAGRQLGEERLQQMLAFRDCFVSEWCGTVGIQG